MFVDLDDNTTVNLDHIRRYGKGTYDECYTITYSNGDVIEVTKEDVIRIEEALISAGRLFNEVRYRLSQELAMRGE